MHEYAHGWMALRCGDPTAKYFGRLSLNPLAHFDIYGAICFLLVGFGWGKPVPINPNLFNKKSDGIAVALAGIITNIIVAFCLAIPLRFASFFGFDTQFDSVLTVLEIIVEFNIALAAFNLIPLPPLDGSHIIEYFLSPAQALYYRSMGPFILLFLVFFNSSLLMSIMIPILKFISILVTGNSSLFFLGN